jgi:hypothetical protein
MFAYSILREFGDGFLFDAGLYSYWEYHGELVPFAFAFAV